MRSVLNTKATLIGGVLAGIGASACCVGPLLLLSLGIGGAWIAHLTALEPYRPIFVGLTMLCFGAAFWKLYLSPASCAVGENCRQSGTDRVSLERTRKVQRILFWTLFAVVLLLVASPRILPLFYR